VTAKDWLAWHADYSDTNSALSRRLREVQRQISRFLDQAPVGEIHVLSLCAGQGRDLLDVLAGHRRRQDVIARLVELDPRNAQLARAAAVRIDGSHIEIVEGDAGITDAYFGAVPVDLLLLVGIFGNISDVDIEKTVRAVPSICAFGATVIWTRSRHEPDITPTIRSWFAEAGCEEVAFVAPSGVQFSVGANRFVGAPHALRTGERLFIFV
jgi:hypothetical protein